MRRRPACSVTPLASLITNSEVLQVLKERGADGSTGRALGVEKLVRMLALHLNTQPPTGSSLCICIAYCRRMTTWKLTLQAAGRPLLCRSSSLL